MANVQDSLEFYKLKVFLYKYTPEFRLKQGEDTSNVKPFSKTSQGSVAEKDKKTDKTSPLDASILQKIERYEIDLDETKYFRKIDISEFVSSYTFNQGIDGNTFDWNIVFHNALIPFDRLNNKDLILEGNPISSETLELLAMYESQARQMTDTDFIREAKTKRGNTQDSFSVRNKPVAQEDEFGVIIKSGIRLEDIIQPYDIITVFLYKGNKPVESLRGTFTGTDDTQTFKELVSKSISDVFKGKKLKPSDLEKESILLSEDIRDKKLTLFSNEFTGFVMTKSVSEEVGAPNILNISGNGITRLFGSTRRVMKSSVLQSSIYDVNEIVQPDAVTPFQNIYVGKTIEEIFLDLFNIVYRIKGEVNSSFYDIAGLKVSNHFQTNLFTVPPFLLAIVMNRLGYRHRLGNVTSLIRQVEEGQTNPKKIQQSYKFGETGDEVSEGKTTSQVDKDLKIDQNLVDSIIQQSSSTITSLGKSPIFFSKELNSLIPYFKFIEDVLQFFSPEMRTPFEIIDELKEKTFLEFFETPEGIIYIRPPAYNDTVNTIFSSTIDVMSSNYSENIGQLLSRQNVGYSDDALPQLEPFQFFAYVSGKLLLQYGLMEARADANPNAKNEKQKDKSEELVRTRLSGLFRYAEYLLRLHNASLKIGNITAVYHPKIRVGRTYFDEKNKKFGYITNVNKAVNTGSQNTVSFTLTYVRDCFLADKVQKEVTVSGGTETVLVENEEIGVTEEIEVPTGPQRVFIFENRNEALDGRFLQFEPLTRLVDLARELSLDKTVNTNNEEAEPGDQES